MNLLIVGNIASGKTTLAQGLRKQAPEHFQKYCSIDNFRKSYSDGTFAGEFNAWAVMLKQIQNASEEGDGIFEFSGTGKNAWFVRSTMDYSKQEHGANWRVIYCSCDPKVIEERCEGRTYDVPIPYNFSNIKSSIDYIGSELGNRANTNYFNSPELFVRTDQLDPQEAVDFVLKELRL